MGNLFLTKTLLQMGSVCAKPTKNEDGVGKLHNDPVQNDTVPEPKPALPAAASGASASGAGGEVKELKTLEEFNSIIKDHGNKLVIVDFSATWCPPCKMIKPIYKKMAQELGDSVICVMVDGDANKLATQAAKIECYPTFQF